MSDVLPPDASAPEPTTVVDAPAPKGRKRIALAAGGVVLVAAVAGGGAWAYQAFYGQGAQAADVLPAEGVLGYVSLDMSPNGEQLLAARSTLKKFPGLADQINLDAKKDLRRELFDKLHEAGGCTDLDYDKQVAPWLGDGIALAFMDAGKGKAPDALFALQTTDTKAADKAADAVIDCLNTDQGADDRLANHAISGDWLLMGEASSPAKDAVKAADKASLADDESFQHWTGSAGDPGIVTGYASPLAAKRIVEGIEAEGDEVPDAIKSGLDEFTGLGAVVRFADGGVQLEAATNSNAAGNKGIVAEHGAAAAGSLPSSTAAALGFGLSKGWVNKALDAYGTSLEKDAGMSRDELVAMIEDQTGLSVPGDIETLTGDSLALAIDGDIDGEAVQQFDPTAIPVGLKIKGDTKAIETVIDKLRATGEKQGMPRNFVVSKTSGDYVVVTFNAKYADKLADDKGLGESDLFGKVVPKDSDAASVFFINFDAGNHWLDKLLKDFGAPDEVTDNVKPLQGIGVSSWVDGDEGHSLLTVTTE
jgi:hypothetical protein